MNAPVVGGLVAWAGRLRFPVLLALTAALFLFDLIIPDFIPFIDEILLGLATAIFANWRKRAPRDGSPTEVPPR